MIITTHQFVGMPMFDEGLQQVRCNQGNDVCRCSYDVNDNDNHSM